MTTIDTRIKIFWRNGYRTVDIKNPPVDSRMLHSYLINENAPSCFYYFQSNWWKIRKNGTSRKICRSLRDLSLKDWKEEALRLY